MHDLQTNRLLQQYKGTRRVNNYTDWVSTLLQSTALYLSEQREIRTLATHCQKFLHI